MINCPQEGGLIRRETVLEWGSSSQQEDEGVQGVNWDVFRGGNSGG